MFSTFAGNSQFLSNYMQFDVNLQGSSRHLNNFKSITISHVYIYELLSNILVFLSPTSIFVCLGLTSADPNLFHRKSDSKETPLD